jgi:hypothetical protein
VFHDSPISHSNFLLITHNTTGLEGAYSKPEAKRNSARKMFGSETVGYLAEKSGGILK